MKLLCLDPGITTGWAAIALVDGKETFSTGNIKLDDLSVVLHDFKQFSPPDVVIIEHLPEKLDAAMRRVDRIVHEVFTEFIEIMPGTWKPVTGRKPIPPRQTSPYFYTPHERDAYRMGRYYIDFVLPHRVNYIVEGNEA